MLKNIRKQQKGFTIIEVLIVLAIAGLIMLIVFLAVPALQRNSRNTQRKNDISGMLGAVQEVLNNNGGNPSTLTNANLIAAAPKPAFYAYTAAVAGGAGGAGAVTALPADATKYSGDVKNTQTTDNFAIYYNAKCGDAAGGASNSSDIVSGSTRQVAIIYKIEPAVFQCTSS